jgi:hypothetical protein
VNAEVILAAAALLISVVVAIRQLQLQSGQHKLQKAIAAIEEERRGEELVSGQSAEILVEIRRHLDDKGKTRSRLILSNVGEAEARNVTFDPSSFGDDLLRSEEHLPIRSLQPHQEYPFVMARSMGSPMSYSVDVDWTDDAGPKTRTLTVGVP